MGKKGVKWNGSPFHTRRTVRRTDDQSGNGSLSWFLWQFKRTRSGISDFRLRLNRQCRTKLTRGGVFVIYEIQRASRRQGDRTEVGSDLMRIGGFVQLKCLAKIHVGRCSFVRKTSKSGLAATASSYPRVYKYKLLSHSLSLLRFASGVEQSRDVAKRAVRISRQSSENWGRFPNAGWILRSIKYKYIKTVWRTYWNVDGIWFSYCKFICPFVDQFVDHRTDSDILTSFFN